MDDCVWFDDACFFIEIENFKIVFDVRVDSEMELLDEVVSFFGELEQMIKSRSENGFHCEIGPLKFNINLLNQPTGWENCISIGQEFVSVDWMPSDEEFFVIFESMKIKVKHLKKEYCCEK